MSVRLPYRTLRRAAAPLPGLLLALLGTHAAAADWELSVDARLVNSDADRSFIKGGMGSVRFDRDDGPLQLGRVRLALNAPLGEVWSAHLDASSWDDHDRAPVGLTEAYLQFRPYPRDGYRLRVKIGEFYPPVSLENRLSGWESSYTLSYSAINSWFATEVRTVGLEAQLDWLGTRRGHTFDLAATAGVYGWNDGAGAVLATDGFLLHDRQTPLFGRVGAPHVAPLFGLAPFVELDRRPGAYAGVEARYLDRLVVRVLRYDNRADPTAYDSVSNTIAWDTRFTSAGARLETADGWTLIAQWLQGKTTIVPQGQTLTWPFHSAFGLLSRRLGRHTASARYDTFTIGSSAAGDGAQNGHALTAAWAFDANAHWRCVLEWLRVRSGSYYRADLSGGSPYATQTQIQFSLRYLIGSAHP